MSALAQAVSEAGSKIEHLRYAAKGMQYISPSDRPAAKLQWKADWEGQKKSNMELLSFLRSGPVETDSDHDLLSDLDRQLTDSHQLLMSLVLSSDDEDAPMDQSQATGAHRASSSPDRETSPRPGSPGLPDFTCLFDEQEDTTPTPTDQDYPQTGYPSQPTLQRQQRVSSYSDFMKQSRTSPENALSLRKSNKDHEMSVNVQNECNMNNDNVCNNNRVANECRQESNSDSQSKVTTGYKSSNVLSTPENDKSSYVHRQGANRVPRYKVNKPRRSSLGRGTNLTVRFLSQNEPNVHNTSSKVLAPACEEQINANVSSDDGMMSERYEDAESGVMSEDFDTALESERELVSHKPSSRHRPQTHPKYRVNSGKNRKMELVYPRDGSSERVKYRRTSATPPGSVYREDCPLADSDRQRTTRAHRLSYPEASDDDQPPERPPTPMPGHVPANPVQHLAQLLSADVHYIQNEVEKLAQMRLLADEFTRYSELYSLAASRLESLRPDLTTSAISQNGSNRDARTLAHPSSGCNRDQSRSIHRRSITEDYIDAISTISPAPQQNGPRHTSTLASVTASSTPVTQTSPSTARSMPGTLPEGYPPHAPYDIYYSDYATPASYGRGAADPRQLTYGRTQTQSTMNQPGRPEAVGAAGRQPLQTLAPPQLVPGGAQPMMTQPSRDVSQTSPMTQDSDAPVPLSQVFPLDPLMEGTPYPSGTGSGNQTYTVGTVQQTMPTPHYTPVAAAPGMVAPPGLYSAPVMPTPIAAAPSPVALQGNVPRPVMMMPQVPPTPDGRPAVAQPATNGDASSPELRRRRTEIRRRREARAPVTDTSDEDEPDVPRALANTTLDYNTRKQVLQRLGRFDPKKVDWRDYYFKFSLAERQLEWNSQESYAQLTVRLEGAALALLADHRPSTYAELVGLLQQEYAAVGQAQDCLADYNTRTYQPGEKVQDYIDDLKRLARRAFPGQPQEHLEPHIMQKFLSGLDDPALAKYMRLQTHLTNLRDMKNAMQRWLAEEKLDASSKPSRAKALDPPRGRQTARAATLEAQAAPRDYTTTYPEVPVQELNSQMSALGNHINALGGQISQLTKNQPPAPAPAAQNASRKPKRPQSPGRKFQKTPSKCWACGELGHNYTQCPKNQDGHYQPTQAQKDWMKKVRDNPGVSIGPPPDPSGQPAQPAQVKKMSTPQRSATKVTFSEPESQNEGYTTEEDPETLND